jgi:hypothetical protein
VPLRDRHQLGRRVPRVPPAATAYRDATFEYSLN